MKSAAFLSDAALSFVLYLRNIKIGIEHKKSRKIPAFLSLLSDSNQRPRDYKSRALAN